MYTMDIYYVYCGHLMVLNLFLCSGHLMALKLFLCRILLERKEEKEKIPMEAHLVIP